MFKFRGILLEYDGPNSVDISILASNNTNEGKPMPFRVAKDLTEEEANQLKALLEKIGQRLTLDQLLG